MPNTARPNNEVPSPQGSLRLLIAEDSTADAELMIAALKSAGYAVSAEITPSQEEYRQRLREGSFDVILCDHNLGTWTGSDGLQALAALGKDIPFIVVSGILGNEIAIGYVKQGAVDCVGKDHLERLPTAVNRALRDKEHRAEESRVQQQRALGQEALRRSEARYRSLVLATAQIVWTTNARGEVVGDLPMWREFTGQSTAEIQGRGWIRSLHPEDQERAAELWAKAVAGRAPYDTEYRLRRHDGEFRRVVDRGVPVLNPDGSIREWVGTCTDVTDRHRAEEILRLQAAVLESAANAIVITDAKGNIEWVNPAFERLTGYSSAEAVGQTPRILRSGTHEEEFYRKMWETILAGGVWQGDLTNQRKDGTLYAEHQTITPVRDLSGAITHFVAIKQDITERKRAEAALRESESRYRSLFDNMLNGFAYIRMVFDGERPVDFVYVEVNRTFETLTGLKAVVGKRASDVIPGIREADPELLRTYGRVARTGVAERFEIWVEALKGWYSISAYGTGSDHVVVVFDVITERKRVEEALLKSEADYRSVIQSAPYAIYRVNESGKILMANPAFLAMLGYATVADVFRLNTARDVYVDPKERERSLALWTSGSSVKGFETEWKRKDGKHIRVRLGGRQLPQGEEKGPACFEVFGEDVTEHRLLEEQFRQAQKMEAVGRLAGGVAHDFNNLLMIMGSCAELLTESRHDPGKTDKYARQIRDAVNRAAALTRQLLAFSRQQVLEPTLLNLNMVVSDLGKMLPRLLGEDVEMVLTLDRNLGNINADRSQIEQVLMNLAVNARDAMAVGGKLTIETANVELDSAYAGKHGVEVSPGRYAMLAVTDTGAGMNASTQARIFEPFFTTKERGKGTGLGLSTVYGIVKQSGGFIWVYSEPDRGTTFKIYLPLVSSSLSAKSAAASVEPTSGGSETILLVEDEADLRQITSEYLQSLGYTVLAEENGVEAIKKCRGHAGPIQVLITDMVMPGMGGAELAKAACAIRPGLKVVYMSGYTDRTVDLTALQPGAIFLQKPISLATLGKRLRSCLEGGSQTP